MSAPTLVVRSTPAKARLRDGYQALVAMSVAPDLSFYEEAVGMPGVEGGEPINTTTQWNTLYRTMAARALQTLTPFTVTGAFHSDILIDLADVVNVEGSISVHFPDNGAITFYGYLQNFQGPQMVEGTMPVGTVTFVPTNTDPVTGTEQGPIYTANAGT